MSKFTPGPWKVINLITGYGIDAGLKMFPYVRVCITRTLSDQDLANAQLIAAAPDMYEALEMVISYLGLPEEFQEGEEILYWKVTNSLKKAKGDPHE